ncbi:CGNR zinc finger domain-containing protein [Nonomuraea roseoviolacea]|uniref:RNA-binding Zn ribbon-like protein n=1 Tax=Nonomuraea roseoviolacea subsp. carminata TaxID=160689 RepID=A0ABT1JV15_9ACTN|nr:CGNR zinc finger domain-containing protein [Nonomuraea roseoviolacea]MCP2345111.1 putative RNA-binding Zn ribbon-like protein [Nonomuraea roseoviolacea subsp. carminata]
MVKEDPLAFRFDCGAIWLNLLATQGRTFGAHPVERLATPGRLAEWLERCELTPARPPDDDDLRLARALRETLRPLALATVDHLPPPASAVAELAAFLAGHDDPIRLSADGRLRREPPRSTADALARIARQAVDQMTGADRFALRSCPEQDCRGVFVDPPGRRRWCPSPACASRGRVRALRARRTAAAAGTDAAAPDAQNSPAPDA